MMRSDKTTDTPQRLAEASPAMQWVARICVTVFTLPFFAVGLGLVFGGGYIGGFGWFGVIFGLAFMSVPTLMLVSIWSPPAVRSTNAPSRDVADASHAGDPPAVPGTVSPVELIACAYCGRPRPATAAKCESCGGH